MIMSTKIILLKALRNSLISTIAIAALTQQGFAQTYYKWKDEAGVWHYGAIAPHGVEAIAIQTKGGSSKSIPSTASSDENSESSETEDNAAVEYFVEKQPEMTKAERKKYCDAAKSNLETLNSKAVIRKRDANGEVTVISDEERQNEIDNAKQTIKDFC
jgi:hypothetical protein